MSLLWIGLTHQKCCPHLTFNWISVRWIRPIDVIIPISETERGAEGLKASGSVLGAGTVARAPLAGGLLKCHLAGTLTQSQKCCFVFAVMSLVS